MEKRSEIPDKKPLVALKDPLALKMLWHNTWGSGVAGQDIKLELAYDNGQMFVADAKGSVYAIEANRGKVIWKKDIKLPLSAGPGAGDGRIFVGTQEGILFALEQQTGNVLWSKQVSSEILAQPVTFEDVVYVHTLDGTLTALSIEDGRQLWRFSANMPPLVLRRSAEPVIGDSYVIGGFANGKVTALRRLEGNVEWSQDIATPKGRTDIQRMIDVSAAPVVAGDKLYVASYRGNLVAMTLSTGQTLWEQELSSFAGLVLDNNLLYVSASDGQFYCIDALTGATHWVQQDLRGRRLSKPSVIDNYVLIGDDDGYLHCLDKKSGVLVGRQLIDRKGVETAPKVINQTIYVLGKGGRLAALQLKKE